MTQRLDYIDAAKGFALIGLIIGHTQAYPLVVYIDNLLLPVFWVSAGYTTRTDFRILPKLRKLLVPYLTMSLICLFYTMSTCMDCVDLKSFIGILYSRYFLYADISGHRNPVCLMNIANGPLWFLTSLFTAYCLYRAILMCARLRYMAAAALVSLAAGYACMYLPILLPWSLDTVFFIAPLMLCGHLMRRFRLLEHQPIGALTGCVAVYAVCNYLVGPTNISIREMGGCYPALFCASVAGAAAMILLFRIPWLHKICQVFAHINVNALYIFGLQLIFIYSVAAIGTKFAWGEWFTAGIQVILAVAGGYIWGMVARRILH